MAQPTSTGRWPYAIVVGLIAGALIARSSLRPWFDEHPYLLAFPAVLIAAWFGGLGPGVLATALSALAAMSVFLPPDGFAVAAGADLLSLALFVATGLGISWINNRLRTAAATSAARAERLDAIIDTTVDGIGEAAGRSPPGRGLDRVPPACGTTVVVRLPLSPS
jgi:K+-sensing histidine kinase KdpD